MSNSNPLLCDMMIPTFFITHAFHLPMGYLAPCYLFTSQINFSYTDVQPFLSSAAVYDAFILEAEATDL